MKKMLVLLLPIIVILAIISDLRGSDLSPMTLKNSFENLEFIQLEFKEINFEWNEYYTESNQYEEPPVHSSGIGFGGGNYWWQNSVYSNQSSFTYAFNKTKEQVSNIFGNMYNGVRNVFDWLEQIYIVLYNIGYFFYWIIGNSSIIIGWFVGMVY